MRFFFCSANISLETSNSITSPNDELSFLEAKLDKARHFIHDPANSRENFTVMQKK